MDHRPAGVSAPAKWPVHLSTAGKEVTTGTIQPARKDYPASLHERPSKMNDKASDLETYTASLNAETDWTSGVGVVTDGAWPDQPSRVAEFGHRVLEDALLEGTARYWERRARDLDAAGLTEEAQACRNRATVERWQEADPAVVLAEWRASL